jgi:flagellin
MASYINTNTVSMNAQRNLSASQSGLATSLQRLSSGLRINSAKDDAAGLAISSRMTAQIGGLNQASRNANDGISLAQTAEGAMGSVNDILLRMRDLSVQSSNGTNSAGDRKTIQNEVDQLTSEINRISSSTQFNGLNLLDGTSTNNTFQIGANANQTISVSIKEVSTKSMALNSTSALGDLNGGRVLTSAPTGAAGELLINGTDIAPAAGDVTATLKATAINAKTGTTGVTAKAYNSLQGTAGATGVTTAALTINGDTIAAAGNLSDLVSNINKQARGVTASIGSNGGLSLTNDDGGNIVVGGTTSGSGLTTGTFAGYVSLTSGTNTPITLSGTELDKAGFNASTGSSSSTGTVVSATVLAATDGVTINGVAVGPSASANASDKAAAINAVKATSGVSATASTSVNFSINLTTAPGANDVAINGTVVDLSAATTLDAVVSAITAAKIQGITATADTATGKLNLSSASGLDIIVSDEGATTGAAVKASGGTITTGKITLTSDTGAAIQLLDKTTTGTGLAKLGLIAQGGNSEAVGGKLDVSTQANAQSAIARIDKAITYVSEQRSTMGAVQNRLSTTISNLASSSENISAARSRIQDTDFAMETASLTRGQILQQAGTAMLAQANSLPNGVLALLR